MNIPLNIDWQQILLHALNLVLLIAGLYLLLYKPVKKFMAQREARYQGMADAAEEKTRQAQQMYDDYAGKLKGVDDEIRTKRAQEMEKTAETAREMLDDARAQADKLIAQGRENGVREKERILQSARGEIARMSEEAARKLVGGSLSQVYDQFLDSAEGRKNDEQPE